MIIFELGRWIVVGFYWGVWHELLVEQHNKFCFILLSFLCHNFNFKLTTKARAWKGADRKCNLGITFTLLKMWENVKQWAHTLPSGLPFWKLKSRWTPKFSKSILTSQNSLNGVFFYTIWKNLKHRCLKWGHIIIWVLTTQIMAKRKVESQIVNLTPNH